MSPTRPHLQHQDRSDERLCIDDGPINAARRHVGGDEHAERGLARPCCYGFLSASILQRLQQWRSTELWSRVQKDEEISHFVSHLRVRGDRMNLYADRDVLAVLVFMQANIPCGKLV